MGRGAAGAGTARGAGAGFLAAGAGFLAAGARFLTAGFRTAAFFFFGADLRAATLARFANFLPAFLAAARTFPAFFFAPATPFFAADLTFRFTLATRFFARARPAFLPGFFFAAFLAMRCLRGVRSSRNKRRRSAHRQIPPRAASVARFELTSRSRHA
jgi:hypothetical protein